MIGRTFEGKIDQTQDRHDLREYTVLQELQKSHVHGHVNTKSAVLLFLLLGAQDTRVQVRGRVHAVVTLDKPLRLEHDPQDRSKRRASCRARLFVHGKQTVCFKRCTEGAYREPEVFHELFGEYSHHLLAQARGTDGGPDHALLELVCR